MEYIKKQVMAYRQSPINFGEGTGSSPLNKNGDPVDKNWTGKEKSGSKEELKALRKDRTKALVSGGYKDSSGKTLKGSKLIEARDIQQDIRSSKKAEAKGKTKKAARIQSRIEKADDKKKARHAKAKKIRDNEEGRKKDKFPSYEKAMKQSEKYLSHQISKQGKGHLYKD